MGRIARAIVVLRWPIVAAWVAAAVILTLTLPTIQQAQVGALGDLVPTEADALEAELRSKRLFGFPLLSRTLVVERDPSGLEARDQADVLGRALAVNRNQVPELEALGGALPVINSFGGPPFSRERSTTAISYLFFPAEVRATERGELSRRYLARARNRDPGTFTGVTGAIAARDQQQELISDKLPLVELATVILVTLSVALHFRSIGAPLVALIAVAISYLVSVRLIARIGQELGVSVPSEVEPVMVVLLFGVVTDYSIFFLSRVRGRLGEGAAPREAAERATAELLPIIVAAGLTVIGASAALVVAELGFFQAFGPGMAMAVAVGLLVAITLVPALLAIGGGAVFWPTRPSAEPRPATAPAGARAANLPRSRLLRLPSTRPGLTAILTTAVLLVAATGLTQLNVGNPLIRGLPAEADARQAYVAASQGFAPGILAPTVIVVEEPGITRQRADLRRLQRLLERQPGVAEVVGPGDQPFASPLGAVLSRTKGAARYFVVFKSDPLGGAAIGDLQAIQRRLPRLLDRAGLPRARASVAGDTALVGETVTKTAADLGRIAPVAMLVVLLILAVFLRAIVAPLYLLAASILALFASLGLTTYVFQGLLGHGELTYYVPFAAAVLLVALGSDYNVFLTGRVWQEARRRPLREAVTVAGARAARPITVAGLVLAGSFALLALVPIRPFRELAFTMAAGLLIDAMVVRTLLVPALISIVGEESGWPGRRLRARADAAAPIPAPDSRP